jgi:hypothetical protein
MNFKVILNSNVGKIVISVLIGLGIACLFHKACKDKECIRFAGPVIKNVDGKIFQHNEKCYAYKLNAVKCDSNKKIVDFGIEHTTPDNEFAFPSFSTVQLPSFSSLI